MKVKSKTNQYQKHHQYQQTKMMDEIKNNPNTNLGFHALEQHTQNWEPNYEGKDNA